MTSHAAIITEPRRYFAPDSEAGKILASHGFTPVPCQRMMSGGYYAFWVLHAYSLGPQRLLDEAHEIANEIRAEFLAAGIFKDTSLVFPFYMIDECGESIALNLEEIAS